MTLAASVEVLETRRDELPDRSRAALDLLVDDVNRFQRLVADLLEISRFDAGAAHLQLEPVLLPEFLSRAVAEATPVPIPVLTGPDADDLVVSVDKRRMAQVIANLVDNAAKYGATASAIRITRSDDGHEVEISVEDHGPGVAPEDRGRIFERFSRGVSAAGTRGADSGSGLGLALVAEHVALHQGHVEVRDRSDGRPGACFVITLPVDDEYADDEESGHAHDLADVVPTGDRESMADTLSDPVDDLP
jgi:signal transduction histidine kinase